MIQLINISKNYGKQELFSNLNFKLNSGNRVGLVGRNGSGKSTLFKLILGEESADSGEIIIPKGYRIGTLKQHLSFSEHTLREEASLALEGDMKYDLYRVEKILFGLGFSAEDLGKNPLSFSGGYQIRINLAKLLVTEPNLLLLDEPTNYLDILSLRWLKQFLCSFEGEVILITHDRDFMDATMTHTMGIVRKGLSFIQGNTHKFYDQLRANDELYEKQKISQDRKVKELEDFIARNKARASTAALAQSKVKQLEKMELMDDLGFDSSLKFDFNFKETPAKVLLDVHGLSFGYTPEQILFKNISFVLKKGECLGIIGKNGKGKSTLLNVIAGELKQLHGTIHSHPSVVSAHFGQTNIARLHAGNSVMDEIHSANTKLSTQVIRSISGAMMFSGDSAEKKVSLLSGGEKSRVMLGQILAREVNLLLLDEPTNHLDMDSIEALTMAIKRFEGSVIIVTHSEELLRSVCDRLIVFAKDTAQYFDGGYDLFLEKIGWEEQEESAKVEKTAPQNNQKESKKVKAELTRKRNEILSPLRKKAEKIEKHIIDTEKQIELNHKLLLDATNINDTKKLVELSKLISEQESSVEESFEELVEVQSQIDKIMEDYEKRFVELEG
ncbi:ABC-F family ATP-binding cassette domain-containing protein [Sulfurimonas sp.]|uniref:ABC-F family ATP-binding cassette domain-containing protein n=1 Tax=Sulfurimonas sp. TaxID=2022749 RepID=UPI0025F7C9E3|nr:ABC-F family ATP-binding cassette domain-containing protein [Sulfurimonas sp.]MDD5157790.1 ABC-F family ATP-binding cassette domain-containing protein [Sulfurimonas sp.]